MHAHSSIISETIQTKSSNSNTFIKEKGNKNSFIPSGIQTKLTIGSPNDHYEKEADQVADMVMKMPASNDSQIVQQKSLTSTPSSFIQRQKGNSEEEEIVQMKKDGSNSNKPSTTLDSSLQKSKGGGKAMDSSTRSGMENSIGADFSKVKIHTNENAVQMNHSLSAKAFTHGNDVYFNKGQYNPKSSEGKHLLAHELAHVVQQRGNKIQTNLIQRYFDASGSKGSAIGHSYRISDDLTAAVKVGYPNHDFYAKAGKAAIANAKLAAVGSGIELKETGTSFEVFKGSNKKTLKKIEAKNKQNATSGDNMKLIDDCGKSCAVVVGSKRRTALHTDAMTGLDAKTSATTPSLMKAEIMKKLLNKWLTMSPTPSQKAAIDGTIAKADAKKLEIDAALVDLRAATTEADKKIKSKIYWKKVDQYGDIMMSYYNTASETKRDEIDKYLKINQYANPDVGQGFTMSSGGTNYPGKSTWNFHWGGVIMKSDDQTDTITLENYAVPGDVENKKWDFAMYGPASKEGQTFHEQHHDTKQHGDKPTTMAIEKK